MVVITTVAAVSLAEMTTVAVSGLSCYSCSAAATVMVSAPARTVAAATTAVPAAKIGLRKIGVVFQQLRFYFFMYGCIIVSNTLYFNKCIVALLYESEVTSWQVHLLEQY